MLQLSHISLFLYPLVPLPTLSLIQWGKGALACPARILNLRAILIRIYRCSLGSEAILEQYCSIAEQSSVCHVELCHTAVSGPDQVQHVQSPSSQSVWAILVWTVRVKDELCILDWMLFTLPTFLNLEHAYQMQSVSVVVVGVRLDILVDLLLMIQRHLLLDISSRSWLRLSLIIDRCFFMWH